jgi:DNA-binding MarR family transcriptional regulator
MKKPIVTPVGRDDTLEGLEGAVSRFAYLLSRGRRHEEMKLRSGVPLDRAAMTLLRQLDQVGAVRPGQLAGALHVEGPHITRQVQVLERRGYVHRRPDPGDRRAQLIELTVAGSNAAARLREASRVALGEALSDWSIDDLEKLWALIERMVDDFIVHSELGADAADLAS